MKQELKYNGPKWNRDKWSEIELSTIKSNEVAKWSDIDLNRIEPNGRTQSNGLTMESTLRRLGSQRPLMLGMQHRAVPAAVAKQINRVRSVRIVSYMCMRACIIGRE